MKENKNYFETFKSKDKNLYGLRLGKPQDAREISQIYKQVYNGCYLSPVVYRLQELKKSLSDKRKYWFIGEHIKEEGSEIFGSGLLEKTNKHTLYASKAVIKKKYRKRGLASVLTSRGILSLLRIKRSEFQDILRLDVDVRAKNYYAQKLFENVRAIPYAFNPIYYNYGNRQNIDFLKGEPFCGGDPEPALLYVYPIGKLWKKRSNLIYLPKNKNVQFLYNFLKKNTRKMRKDILKINKEDFGKYEGYRVNKDLYLGILYLKGYISESTVQKLSEFFGNWRVINWYIPTTKLGLYSMKVALKKGFNPIGYDIGSFYDKKNKKFHDCVVMAYFPHGIKFNQFEEMRLVEGSIPLVNRVLKMLNIDYQVKDKKK
jgi:ribosomal protein S18 acetylase RimI-like enzyme